MHHVRRLAIATAAVLVTLISSSEPAAADDEYTCPSYIELYYVGDDPQFQKDVYYNNLTKVDYFSSPYIPRCYYTGQWHDGLGFVTVRWNEMANELRL